MKKLPKFLRIMIWTVLALGGLIFLAWNIENWRGGRVWAETQDRLERNEIPLSHAKLVREPIPDADNFWMTPLLAGAELMENEDVRERIEQIQIELFADVDRKRLRASWPEVSSAKRADLSMWRERFDGDAQAVADGLDGLFGAEFQELAEASERSGARLNSDWAEAEYRDVAALAAIEFPHYKVAMTLGKALTLRALVALEAGDSEGAVDWIRAQNRLAEAVSGDPSLLGHLVMVVLREQAHGVVWEGLARQAWSREQLLELKSELQRIDSIENFAWNIQGELIFQISAMEFLQNASRGELKSFSDPLEAGGLGYTRWTPAGWIEQNKVFCVNWMLDGVILPARDRAWKALAAGAKIPVNRRHPYRSFAMMVIPAVDKVSEKAAFEFMTTQLGLAACEAELHRLEHGSYPDSLPAGYEDFDGKPLRYRLVKDGRPRIYSIGWNFADDGGDAGSKDDLRQGDWVWKY
ncbi:MAG: hypothetical protein ACI8UO_004985 [Verrucomicrobiales bacterium]|jgi:hypothetical protein